MFEAAETLGIFGSGRGDWQSMRERPRTGALGTLPRRKWSTNEIARALAHGTAPPSLLYSVAIGALCQSAARAASYGAAYGGHNVIGVEQLFRNLQAFALPAVAVLRLLTWLPDIPQADVLRALAQVRYTRYRCRGTGGKGAKG